MPRDGHRHPGPHRDRPVQRRHPAGVSATGRRSRGSTRRRPRRATSSRSRSATACSSAGARSRRRDGATFTTVDPATEQPLAEVARATPADIDKAVRAARRAQRRRWGTLPGKERAKYLFRIARILQERSREFAVLESMDSGKPIKESRDVDVPLAAAPLLVLRRLGRQARLRVPGAGRAAARRGRPDHPVELPAADAGLEDRAGPGGRQHGRPQARLDHAAVGAALRRGLPPGRPAAGRRQHRPGPGRGRDVARHRTRGVDKVAFTGSTEIGRQIFRGRRRAPTRR